MDAPTGKYEVTIQILSQKLSVLIGPADEAHLRQAVERIEAKLATYKQTYAKPEDAKLLLMCCIELATEWAQLQQAQQQLTQGLAQLDDQLAGVVAQLAA